MTRIDSLLRGAAIGALALLAACSGTTDFTVSKTFDVVSVGGQAYSFAKDVDLQTDAPDAWKHRDTLSAADATTFGVGLVVSFIAAFVVIRWLIRYVATHDFKPFAWYRIAFGIVVLATWWLGAVNWSAG